MRNKLRDAAHLILPAIVFLAALGVFVVLRSAVVPPEFGRYGHYNPAALEVNRAVVPAFAGQQECATCHDEAVQARAAGKHARVACEACHGANAKHAADPGALKPERPDSKVLCGRCHEKDAAKPAGFPQVEMESHSGGAACKDCHQPHQPKL